MHPQRTRFFHVFPFPLVCLVAIALGCAPASAHDIRGVFSEMSSVSPVIASALDSLPPDDVRTKSVLNNLKLWPVPRRLSICFLEGSGALRKRAADAMQKAWPLAELTGGGLTFGDSFRQVPSCERTKGGGRAPADISVDFNLARGYESLVGLESFGHVPSMNLSNLTETSPDSQAFEEIVAHEFGHALGLEHEHQNPGLKQNCDWDYAFMRKKVPWDSDEQMTRNLDRLQDYMSHGRHAYVFSNYDQKSIMHYALEPEAFLSGAQSPCFITQNQVPSEQDKKAIQAAYGPGSEQQQRLLRESVSDVSAKLSDPRYREIRRLLNLKAKMLAR